MIDNKFLLFAGVPLIRLQNSVKCFCHFEGSGSSGNAYQCNFYSSFERGLSGYFTFKIPKDKQADNG